MLSCLVVIKGIFSAANCFLNVILSSHLISLVTTTSDFHLDFHLDYDNMSILTTVNPNNSEQVVCNYVHRSPRLMLLFIDVLLLNLHLSQVHMVQCLLMLIHHTKLFNFPF